MRLVLLSAGGLLAIFILGLDGQHSASRPVGFRVLESTDASRVTDDFPQGRPIQIANWYPAAAPGRPLPFGDLVRRTAGETDFARRTDEDVVVEKYRAFLGQAGVTREQAEAWLATPMKAARDAPPADNRFPLVLIAQGNGDSASDQALLAEILAARGFLVATTPSQARIGGLPISIFFVRSPARTDGS